MWRLLVEIERKRSKMKTRQGTIFKYVLGIPSLKEVGGLQTLILGIMKSWQDSSKRKGTCLGPYIDLTYACMSQ
jgi:hypothetical protein